MRATRQWLSVLLLCMTVSMYAENAMVTEYESLLQRFPMREKSLKKELDAYLIKYPYSPYKDEVYFMRGVVQTERGKYKVAWKEFERKQALHTSLSRDHQLDYQFYRGYCHMMSRDDRQAVTYFNLLRKGDNRYSLRAKYYYAYCQYRLQNTDEALAMFLQLENESEFRESVPYILVQIYHEKGDIQEVVRRSEKLLEEQPNNKNNNDLTRILGEIYYSQGLMKEAAKVLQKYDKEASDRGEKVARYDLYILGMSLYRLDMYKDAESYLLRVDNQRDSLNESTQLALGNLYIKMGDNTRAMNCYKQAADLNITPKIHEEALYNYALCAYQRENSSTAGVTEKAFNQFLKECPNSPYTEHIYSLLSNDLVAAKNYVSAYGKLGAIEHPSPEVLSNKQYLRYQQGVDAYLAGRYEECGEWMTEVINNTKDNDKYTLDAYYWLADVQYRQQHYEAAAGSLSKFFRNAKAQKSANYGAALYLSGYTFFALQKYEESAKFFAALLKVKDVEPVLQEDALCRMGDCYFNNRNFANAIHHYTAAVERDGVGADYAAYQRGIALGLQHKYDDKVRAMRQLLDAYPNSYYADDALYEMARAQVHKDDELAAIRTYEEFLDNPKFKKSEFRRRVSMERAMLYSNQEMYEQAIAAYKQTIAEYPNSDEAYSALDALQHLYVETDKVDEFIQFTKASGMKTPTTEDSLVYAAAELHYMQNQYAKAAQSMELYLKSYCPNGRYCVAARYYAADSYYRLGRISEAIKHYQALADIPGNSYLEEACLRVAELTYFDTKNYAVSLTYYSRLRDLATTSENARKARMGMLRCYQLTSRWPELADMATEVLTAGWLDQEDRQEALYCRAKAKMQQKDIEGAMPDLQELARDVRTAYGAEAKYYVCQYYMDKGMLSECEQEITSFSQQNTQHRYWLAKSLIMLADIYQQQEDYIMAIAYLEALSENYETKNDGILSAINERLSVLTVLQEAQEAAEALEDEDEDWDE